MPRDSAPPADAMVDLPAGRRGRVCMADDAGSFKIEVIGADWIGRLAGAGALDRTQTEAAQVLALLFERSSIRPRLAGRYDAMVVDHCAGAGDQLLEARSTPPSWRPGAASVGRCPPHCRGQVEGLAFWDARPTSMRLLREGLDAVARALGLARR